MQVLAFFFVFIIFNCPSLASYLTFYKISGTPTQNIRHTTGFLLVLSI